jgi:uncharacterized membrane protein YkoI
MSRQRKIVAAVTATLAVGAGGVGAAVATSGDDGEAPITGSARAAAAAAAIEHVGGGRVTDTEVGDEESYYEVEVTRADGTQVDVQLDRNFRPVGQQGDSEKESEPGDED